MIAADLATIIRTELAEFITVEPLDDGAINIQTPFVFDDGDRMAFVASRQNGSWLLSDEGDVISRLSMAGKDILARGHVSRLNQTLRFYGVSQENGTLKMEADPERLGEAIRMFAQASFEAMMLARLPSVREKAKAPKRTFETGLAQLIESVIPEASLESFWFDRNHDSEGVYRVDYRISTRGSDWFVFGVEKDLEALRAAVSILHYLHKEIRFKSIVVFNDKDALKEIATKPLDDVATVQFPTIEDRESIKNYLLTEVLSVAG